MKRLVLLAALAVMSLAPTAHAQFGGVVFDPTQSGHAIQQLVQETGISANTLQEMQTAIKAYNFTRQMMTAPQTLYQPFISPYTWEAAINTSANTYNNTSSWTNAANTGSGASLATQAYVPRTGSQLPGYGSLTTQSQQQIAAQGATSDLNDSVNATTLQTLGTIRSNAQQRRPISPTWRQQVTPSTQANRPSLPPSRGSTRHSCSCSVPSRRRTPSAPRNRCSR